MYTSPFLHTTYDSNQAHTSSTTIRFSGLMFAKQRTHLPRSPAFASRPRPTLLESSKEPKGKPMVNSPLNKTLFLGGWHWGGPLRFPIYILKHFNFNARFLHFFVTSSWKCSVFRKLQQKTGWITSPNFPSSKRNCVILLPS